MPEAPSTPATKDQLAQIRRRHDAATAGDWFIVATDEAMQLAVRETPQAAPLALYTASDLATSDDNMLMLYARSDIGLLLATVDWARDALVHHKEQIRQLQARLNGGTVHRPGTADDGKDYTTECCMKLQEPAFIKYLQERHELPKGASQQARETRMRSVLGITSRKQLNTDTAAAARWRSLRGDFEAWRKAP